jgi:hypothetical protein
VILGASGQRAGGNFVQQDLHIGFIAGPQISAGKLPGGKGVVVVGGYADPDILNPWLFIRETKDEIFSLTVSIMPAMDPV